MFRTILAAVDGSARAPAVVRTALLLADRFDATALLYRALEVPPDFPPAAAFHLDDLGPALLERAVRELERLADGHPRATVHPPALLAGSPWRAILRTAGQLDADLIVLGSHGYSGWDHVLGTTAGKVVAHADRPVLVVRERPAPAARSAP